MKFNFADWKNEILLGITVFLLATSLTIFGAKSSLDAKFYYSGPEAEAFITALSPEDRALYIRNEWIDLAFIAAYTALLFSLGKRLYPASQKHRALLLAPGFFDLIETTLVLWLLHQPQIPAPLDGLGLITSIKWIAAVIAVCLILRRFFS